MDVQTKFYFTEVSGEYAKGEPYRKVRPVESDEYLGNPHKGLQTFQHFNGDPLYPGRSWSEEGPHEFEFVKKGPPVVDGHLPSTVCYNRWNWCTFEPEEGKYDFSVIENSLKVCRLRGQSLHIRLMSYSGGASPELPEWYRTKYKVKQVAQHWEPEHNSKEYFKLWGGLLDKALKICGNHPEIDIIDTAFNGQWGEGAGDMTAKRCADFVDIYLKHVPTQKLVVDMGHELVYGAKKGTGWRANCFGDMRNYGHGIVPNGLGWNHHYDAFPERIIEAGMTDNWKHAPVVFETCGNPIEWYNNNMPLEFLDFIIEQGLKYHCSLFMPKYSLIPEVYKDKLMKFIRRMGYRYVLRYFKFNSLVKKDRNFTFDMWIENVGVAPIYRDLYTPALRLSQGNTKQIIQINRDMRQWLPGDSWIKHTIKVPAAFKRGKVNIEVALVRKDSSVPAIRFAIKGTTPDGWHPVDALQLE